MGFLSLFIVIPKLTSMPAVYGIYSICMFATIFFTYADIGFISAGYKYASEKFAVNNLEEEIRIVGFISFILFASAILFSAATIIFAINPHMLIKDLTDPEKIAIASKLLLTLALFSPVIVLQRLCQIVFGIRLEDFIYQRLIILASIIRITSVFYFFGGPKYDIVGYFLFFQVIGLIANIIFLFIIRTRYHYDIIILAKSFRFSTDVYNKTKKLAFGSFLITLIFILYYEMDLVVIGKLSGAEMAGFYGVGMALMGFLRGIFGSVYSPFSARFNHFVGLNELLNLKTIFYSVMIFTIPLVVFPVISLIVLMKPFILCWVGVNYKISIIVAQFLVATFMYSFIDYPVSILLTSQVRIKVMCAISIMTVFIYWTGIILTFPFLGIKAFAIFKFITWTLSATICFILAAKFLESKSSVLLKRIASPAIIPTLFLIAALTSIIKFMPSEKSSINLLIVISAGAICSLIASVLYYVFSRQFKNYVDEILKKIFAWVYDKLGLSLPTPEAQ